MLSQITFSLLLYTLPLFGMISLIPLLEHEVGITLCYTLVAVSYFILHKWKKLDLIVYTLGFIAMTLFETIFLLTHVEIFTQRGLFGIMPLWLPFLWAYGFLVIKDSLAVITKYVR